LLWFYTPVELNPVKEGIQTMAAKKKAKKKKKH
jgi:hypothetical protein